VRGGLRPLRHSLSRGGAQGHSRLMARERERRRWIQGVDEPNGGVNVWTVAQQRPPLPGEACVRPPGSAEVGWLSEWLQAPADMPN